MKHKEPIEAVFTSIPQGPKALWYADYHWHLAHPDTLYRVRPYVPDELPLLPDDERASVTGVLVMFVDGVNGPRRLRAPVHAGDNLDETAAIMLQTDAPVNAVVASIRGDE